ncbi:MAG: hypothetical protein NXI16_16460 [Alphaproteobacteria bacterium]|nr:hypothetical protein [Alphaproteobacteria bacterium]
MIKFRHLSDNCTTLAYSPLLRAALLTAQYVEQNGSIGLTPSKAFKRVFVHWAAEHFDWPGMSQEELFHYNKVLNEFDFPPLELLHFLLVKLKLGRHIKRQFKLTKRGAEILKSPYQLFAELIPFYLLNVDHSSYARFDNQLFGNWDVWLNVINVKVDQGATETHLFSTFYGGTSEGQPDNWRERVAFRALVLRPLEWAGLLAGEKTEGASFDERYYFKTPLWHSALELDLDSELTTISKH